MPAIIVVLRMMQMMISYDEKQLITTITMTVTSSMG